jgi:hypothetical protein
MGMDLHASRNFMIAVHRAEMKSSEFVYIIPWLAHIHDHYPVGGFRLLHLFSGVR